MPIRKYPLVNDQIYHVYNRSVAQQPIFRNKREYNIFLNLIVYYKFVSPPMRFSFLSRLDKEEKAMLIENLYKSNNNLFNAQSLSPAFEAKTRKRNHEFHSLNPKQLRPLFKY